MYWPYKCFVKSCRVLIKAYSAAGCGYYDEAVALFDHFSSPSGVVFGVLVVFLVLT